MAKSRSPSRQRFYDEKTFVCGECGARLEIPSEPARKIRCPLCKTDHFGRWKIDAKEKNNPKKVVGLEGFGLEIVERVPIEIRPESEKQANYLKTKQEKLGHVLRHV